MIFDPRYSRSTRIGDLYQSRLFDKVPLPSTAPGEPALAKPEWISDLAFVPKGDREAVQPEVAQLDARLEGADAGAERHDA